MTFDFGTLIIVIIIALLMVLGATRGGALYNLLTVPFIVYLIVQIQAVDAPGLPSVGLAGLALLNIGMAWRHFTEGGS